MKTALCFTGTGRSIQHTFDNIKSYLIEDLKNTNDGCDVFVYLAKTPTANAAEKLFSGFSERIDVVEEEYTDPEGSNFKFLDRWPPTTPDNLTRGRDIYLKMIKSRKNVMGMIESSGKKYDRVIFSRMDVQYEKKISETIDCLDMNYLWLPSFHHWLGGYNDRFAVSNQSNMKVYLSQWDRMETYRDNGHVFHAESTLKYHLNNEGITPKIFECNFIRIRPDGKPASERENFSEINKMAVRTCDI